MSDLLPRRRGGQLGNQNARKHGFYARKLNNVEKYALRHASEIEGIDQEIALMRVKIQSSINNSTDNLKTLTMATETLGRLLRTKLRLSPKEDERKMLQQALHNAMMQIAAPAGILEDEVKAYKRDHPDFNP